jgi:hypothetical protein
MAASEAWAAQVTFARLVNKGVPPEKIQIPNLVAMVPDALKRLTKAFAQFPESDARRQLFEAETTVALTAGVGDLAALEAANYLPDTIDPGNISHASSSWPLQPLADESQLNFPWPRFYIYYCIAGNQIKTRNTDGSLTSLSGTLGVVAMKIPTISELKEQLWAEFLDEMEILAMPAAQ